MWPCLTFYSPVNGKQSLSYTNTWSLTVSFKWLCVMEANSTSWPDYKFPEKQFWNINVAWIYWGSVAPHLSLMASPSCCLPDCGLLKWTDLRCTAFTPRPSRGFVCVEIGVFVCWIVRVSVALCNAVSHSYISDWKSGGCLFCISIMSVSTFCLCMMKCVPHG